MFSGLFITVSLCHSWGHILELFSFTSQKILEGKDKCHPASLEWVVYENSKYSPGSLCLCEAGVGSAEGGCRQCQHRAPFWGVPIYFWLPRGPILKGSGEFMCFQTAKEVLTCPTPSLSPLGGPVMLREVLGQSEQPLSSGGCACSVQSWIPTQSESLSLYFPLEPRKMCPMAVPMPAPVPTHARVMPLSGTRGQGLTRRSEPSPQAGRMPSRCQQQLGSPER